MFAVFADNCIRTANAVDRMTSIMLTHRVPIPLGMRAKKDDELQKAYRCIIRSLAGFEDAKNSALWEMNFPFNRPSAIQPELGKLAVDGRHIAYCIVSIDHILQDPGMTVRSASFTAKFEQPLKSLNVAIRSILLSMAEGVAPSDPKQSSQSKAEQIQSLRALMGQLRACLHEYANSMGLADVANFVGEVAVMRLVLEIAEQVSCMYAAYFKLGEQEMEKSTTSSHASVETPGPWDAPGLKIMCD